MSVAGKILSFPSHLYSCTFFTNRNMKRTPTKTQEKDNTDPLRCSSSYKRGKKGGRGGVLYR